MSTVEARQTWLERILSPFQSKQVNEQLTAKRLETSEAAAALDGAGLQRKGVSTTAPGENAPASAPVSDAAAEATADSDAVLKVAMTLADQIKAGVGGDYTKLTDEGLVAALANALQAAMPPSPMDNENDIQEEVTMDDNVKAMDKPVDEGVQAFIDTLGSLVKDQKELAEQNTAQAAAISEINKSLKPTVDQLVSDINAIKQSLSQRPRSASEDDSTEPSLSDAERKALEGAIEKGLKGPKTTFLGVAVKEIPK